MVTSWPRGFAVLDDAATYLNNMVNEMSDGTLTIDKKAPGELVGAFEVFDAVSSGQADMYHSADYYFIGQHPAYAYYTAVPFGGTAQELTNWYHHGGGHELHNELGEIFNLKSFLAGNSGSQSGGWFRNEINSVDDLKGLKYRTTGLASEMCARIGMAVQAMSGPAMFQALQSGALDAGEFIGPWTDSALGFHQLAKNYYWPGVGEPSSAEECGVNADAWNALPDDLKSVVSTACASLYNDVWTCLLYTSPSPRD